MTTAQKKAIDYIKKATNDQERQSRIRCLNYQTYGALKRHGYIKYSPEQGYQLTDKVAE